MSTEALKAKPRSQSAPRLDIPEQPGVSRRATAALDHPNIVRILEWSRAEALPLVYLVVWRVLAGPFSAEVQSMVIGAVVSGVLSSITGFWLGSSASSQRKDQPTTQQPPAPPAPQE